MREREFSRAMQAAAYYSSDSDADEFVAKFARRDQRRLRLLTSLCIFLWLLATAGLVLLVLSLDRLVLSIRIAEVFPQHREILSGTGLLHHSVWIIIGAVAAMLVAAVFTVVLVHSSRRATLRHINMRIGALLEQLQQLWETQGPDERVSAGLKNKFEL